MMEAAEAQLEQSYDPRVCVCTHMCVYERERKLPCDHRVALCGTPAPTHHPGYRYGTGGLQLEEL